MQTFLPLASFSLSARVLDRQRLGKQRVECVQLLQVLTRQKLSQTVTGWTTESSVPKGWANHPAARMWQGFETSLAEYGLAVCDEWIRRTYQDSCRARILTLVPAANPSTVIAEIPKPPWFGDEAFHASHRSNLLRKDPRWYGQFEWDEPSDLPYVWPV